MPQNIHDQLMVLAVQHLQEVTTVVQKPAHLFGMPSLTGYPLGPGERGQVWIASSAATATGCLKRVHLAGDPAMRNTR